MVVRKVIIFFLLGTVSLNVSAQAESRMEEMRSRAFGARNTVVKKAEASADSAARVAVVDSLKRETDTKPSFPGGEMFLQAYLKKKVLHSGVKGKGDVVVGFNVDKKGNIYGAEVTQSTNATLNTAAFNIVTGMPRWKPGLSDGKPADKPATVTISFGKEE